MAARDDALVDAAEREAWNGSASTTRRGVSTFALLMPRAPASAFADCFRSVEFVSPSQLLDPVERDRVLDALIRDPPHTLGGNVGGVYALA